MGTPDVDKVFAGSIPQLYEEYMVPLIFQPYAEDLARRVAARPRSSVAARVLEIAAGTGVLTRQLASVLTGEVSIVATDLNRPMLDMAAAIGASRPVEWREADAMQLPFEDRQFDAVVCQFGAMFFPDKSQAFAEARRVLREGGVFLFNVWDRIEENDFAHIVTTTLASLFPMDPPRFMARTPHGYFDLTLIGEDLYRAGFATPPYVETLAARSIAASARIAAIAYCQGTLLRNEIEARDNEARDNEARKKSRLDEATDLATAAIARRFGTGPVDGKIQAHIVAVGR